MGRGARNDGRGGDIVRSAGGARGGGVTWFSAGGQGGRGGQGGFVKGGGKKKVTFGCGAGVALAGG